MCSPYREERLAVLPIWMHNGVIIINGKCAASVVTKAFRPLKGLIIPSNPRIQQQDNSVGTGFTNAHLFTSNIARLHQTLRTHTYLSAHVGRGYQTSRVDSRPAPWPPAYTKYVLECQRRWIPPLSWFGSSNYYQRDPYYGEMSCGHKPCRRELTFILNCSKEWLKIKQFLLTNGLCEYSFV